MIFLDLHIFLKLIKLLKFSLSEKYDESELGVELEWMSIKSIFFEAKENYPGKIAIKKGFLPVGTCLEGSGDPYFLNCNLGSEGMLVRIPHDACNADDLKLNEIEVVSNTLNLFFENAVKYENN